MPPRLDSTGIQRSDLRFQVADLQSLHLQVKDIGGYWEARIGRVRNPFISNAVGRLYL
jgi:hypothetical protein